MTSRLVSSVRSFVAAVVTLGMAVLIGAQGVKLATLRASVSSVTGIQGNYPSDGASASSDGRFVAFRSDATNLVPLDTNAREDIFVRDTVRGTTVRASVASNGYQGNERSRYPRISGSGRYVSFRSLASNLVPGDSNIADDIFIRDLQAETTARVSVASDGSQANGGSNWSCITSNGRYVAFDSAASNLVLGDTNNSPDVFVRDLLTGSTVLASWSWNGAQANMGAVNPAISADGRYVVFESSSSNLVPGGTTGDGIFKRDLLLGTTTLVSIEANGSGTYTISPLSMSADGRYVAFDCGSEGFGGAGVPRAIFLCDTQTGTTTRVSVTTGSEEGNGRSYAPSISADGRFVAFHSLANNLVPGDINGTADVFVRDMETSTTRRISVATNWSEGNGDSVYPSLSADGRYVGFTSSSNNLVSGDTNGLNDVFVRGPARIVTSRPRTGQITGNVFDDDSQIGVPGVNVAFYSSGAFVGAGTTDINGNFVAVVLSGPTTFTLGSVPNGYYSSFRYLGHRYASMAPNCMAPGPTAIGGSVVQMPGIIHLNLTSSPPPPPPDGCQ